MGDRDPTYLRTHVTAQYDEKLADGPVTTSRFRLKLEYAFGAFQRFAASVLVPILQRDTPGRSASGFGDTEVQAAVNFYRTEQLRIGAAFQGTFRTSSDMLLRTRGSTTIEPSLALTGVLSDRFEVTSAIYYIRSIRTVREAAAKQLASDISVNVRTGKATLFLESDSFYDFIPKQFAPTIKTGISVAVGHDRLWVVNGYYSVGLNDYARRSQYKHNAGADLTWFPFKHR